VYIRNGAIYARFPEIVLGGSLWGDTPLAYVMPKERSTNINDEVDFVLAETLLKR
jgi:CMP-N-acetylneuraminic acid synthetase